MAINSNRISWVDTFRAIMIFFVAFGHAVYDFEPIGAACNLYIHSFHVAGFFFVSGYLFSLREIGFLTFVKNKFKSLMIPYYFFQ